MTLTAIKVRGPYKGPSGYDHHVREFVRELHRQGVAVELIDVPEWGPARLAPELQDPWFDSLTRPVPARIALHFMMPHQVVPDAGMINANFTMFEATRVQPRWIAHNRTHDLLIVPADSSREAWMASGMPADRISVCPLGIDPARYRVPAAPLPLHGSRGELLTDYKARFLNISELGPRKNLNGLLRTWLNATSHHDDAVLILKLGAHAPGWREEFEQQLDALQRQTGKQLADAAPLHIIYETFADADMPRLFATATHYISMSHGEGWDLPMLEAAASGLRLIAPDHSAYTAYLDRTVAHLIPSREVPAAFPGGGQVGALFDNVNWWEPDEAAAAAFVRSVIAGTDCFPASPRARMLRDFTWEKATQRLIAILSDLERSQSRHAGITPPERSAT